MQWVSPLCSSFPRSRAVWDCRRCRCPAASFCRDASRSLLKTSHREAPGQRTNAPHTGLPRRHAQRGAKTGPAVECHSVDFPVEPTSSSWACWAEHHRQKHKRVIAIEHRRGSHRTCHAGPLSATLCPGPRLQIGSRCAHKAACSSALHQGPGSGSRPAKKSRRKRRRKEHRRRRKNTRKPARDCKGRGT